MKFLIAIFVLLPLASFAQTQKVWKIGEPDLLDAEFGEGSATELIFTMGLSKTSDWKRIQLGDVKAPPVYRVIYHLARVPAEDLTLGIDVYFTGRLPERARIDVNGERGTFRVQPQYARDLDFSRTWALAFSSASLRIPVQHGWLRSGENEIAISWYGEDASVHYDALWLDAVPAPPVIQTVEPTVFFQRVGNELRERTEVIIPFQRPTREMNVSLALGGNTFTASANPTGMILAIG